MIVLHGGRKGGSCGECLLSASEYVEGMSVQKRGVFGALGRQVPAKYRRRRPQSARLLRLHVEVPPEDIHAIFVVRSALPPKFRQYDNLAKKRRQRCSSLVRHQYVL